MRYDGDYCPTYSAPPYSTFDNDTIPDGPLYSECALGTGMLEDMYDFESTGSSTSRCVNTVDAINRPLCLNVECLFTDDDVSVVITVSGGKKVMCQSDGELIDLESLDMQIECPRREVICPE